MKGESAVFLLLFLLWVLFNGRLTGEIVWLGLVVAGLLYAFCCAFLDFSPRKELRLARLVGLLLGYAGTLLWEIVKSNFALCRRCLTRRGPQVDPVLVTFKTPLTSPLARATLANSITLTPGTLTALIEGDTLTVHCLDAAFAEGVEDTVFQRKLLRMEEVARRG